MAYAKTNWTNTTPINTANLNKIENGIADLYDAIFPVGQIVIKGDNADYSNWLGFTWERTAVGKVLIGIDNADNDFDTIGETGGEKEHTLTIAEMPNHNHKGYISGGDLMATQAAQGGYNSAQITQDITSTGGDQPHNNMPPYQVVAYWKRIA